MNNVIFVIDGMHCGGCAATVRALLEQHVGVRKASASFDTREAQVLYDPGTVSEEQLVSVIEKIGYRVTERRASS